MELIGHILKRNIEALDNIGMKVKELGFFAEVQEVMFGTKLKQI